MKRPVVAIASLLKPINDSRMYEKIGRSLAQSNKYEVNIIGFPANKPDPAPNINFFPLPFFKRLSTGRIYAGWSAWRRIWRLRPDLLIICTPELLPAAALYRLLTGSQVVYDVWENYSLNLRTQQVYPVLLRDLAGGMTRMLERGTRPLISWYFLAEKCYQYQLPFVKDRNDVLENKYGGTVRKGLGKRDCRKLLFSGTIGPHTGVFAAIRLAKALHRENKGIQLHISGHALHGPTRKRMLEEIRGHSFITSRGISQAVPHEEILRDIEAADAGIICYENHPSTAGNIPTKLFEYLAHQLPVIMEKRAEWMAITEKYPAAIPIDFKSFSPSDILGTWEKSSFYTDSPGPEVHWKSEEAKLLNRVRNLLNAD